MTARRDDRADPFPPTLPGRAAGALGQASMDGHEPEHLLGQVVGGFNLRFADEAEVALGVLKESLGEVTGFLRAGASKVASQSRALRGRVRA